MPANVNTSAKTSNTPPPTPPVDPRDVQWALKCLENIVKMQDQAQCITITAKSYLRTLEDPEFVIENALQVINEVLSDASDAHELERFLKTLVGEDVQ